MFLFTNQPILENKRTWLYCLVAFWLHSLLNFDFPLLFHFFFYYLHHGKKDLGEIPGRKKDNSRTPGHSQGDLFGINGCVIIFHASLFHLKTIEGPVLWVAVVFVVVVGRWYIAHGRTHSVCVNRAVPRVGEEVLNWKKRRIRIKIIKKTLSPVPTHPLTTTLYPSSTAHAVQ